MSMSRICLALAVALLGGCAGAQKTPAVPEPQPAATPAPRNEAEPEPVADVDDEGDEAQEMVESEGELAQAEGTQVLEIEADDLGGAVDTIRAEPERPQLPSMMKDIRMGPSG